MVDTHALGACVERREGSSPSLGTKFSKRENRNFIYTLEMRTFNANIAAFIPQDQDQPQAIGTSCLLSKS